MEQTQKINDSLRLFVQKVSKLPTIPVVARELLSVTDNGLVSLDKLEKIVSKDPAISAKIVGLSNAAFFGYKMTDTTVAGAIQKIGFTNVKNIALGIALMTIFDVKRHRYSSDYSRIYKHCIATGFVTARIAAKLGMKPDEDLFLCGMLHDIGLLLMNNYFPELYCKTAEKARERKNLLEAETVVLGFTHADIGAWIADTWGLPDKIHEVILNHHTPSLAVKHKECVAIVHLADHITCRRFVCMFEQPIYCPVDPLAMFLLDMPDKTLADLDASIPDDMFAEGIFEA